MLLQEIII